MFITAYVKNREPSFYLKNCSSVTLLFKDKGGLANHPLSCHPLGVFASRKSGRKREKMRGEKKQRENSSLETISSKEKMRILSKIFHLSLYSAQISKKNTKIPSIPILHEGQNWKIHKRKSNGGQWSKRSQMQEVNFVGCELQCSISLVFCSSFLLISDL